MTARALGGMECQASISERAITPSGPIIRAEDWVTVAWHVMSDPSRCHDRLPGCHLNVTDRSTPAIVRCQWPGLLTPERGSQVQLAGAAWSDWDSDYIPSHGSPASPVTGSLEQLVVAKLSLLTFVCFAGTWSITPPVLTFSKLFTDIENTTHYPTHDPSNGFQFFLSKWISFSSELAWVSCWRWMMPNNSTRFVEKMGLLHCSLHCNFNIFSSPKYSSRVFR